MTLTSSVEPEWAMATILFADIRGFTTLAERVSALEAVAFLNAFFDVALPVIERHGGFAPPASRRRRARPLRRAPLLADHPDRALAAGTALTAHAAVGPTSPPPPGASATWWTSSATLVMIRAARRMIALRIS